MITRDQFRPAVILLVLVAMHVTTGCAQKVRRPEQRPEAPGSSAVVPPPPPPPSPPPPSELDVTLEAAARAESSGDRATALQQYERAAWLAVDSDVRARIHFALALLHADPCQEAHDLERARAELQTAVEEAPAGPLAPQARLLSALIEEVSALRAQSADVRTQLETAKTEVANLRTKLDEKAKELAEIKKILLRDKGKP